MKIWPLLLILLFQMPSYAEESCSRTAIINYQEVLVDTSATTKGEGLRFYLEKDEIAKKYLNEYQRKSNIHWHNAVLGTIGTVFILTGIVQAGNDSSNKILKEELLFASGGAVLLLNFLIGRTLQHNNEQLLHRAINEYNKRNLPKIYFSPFGADGEKGFNAGFTKEF